MNIRYYLQCIIFTGILPIIFEGINVILHGGQYDSFPFRYGFIPIFFMIILSNYYINNYIKERSKKNSIFCMEKVLFIIYLSLSIIISIIISYISSIGSIVFQTNNVIVILLVIYNFFIMYVYEYVIRYSESDVLYKVLFFIIIIEKLIFMYGFLGNPGIWNDPAHSDTSVKNVINIVSELDEYLDYNTGYRYKDLNNLMLENAPLQSKLPSISSWVQMDKEKIETFDMLGFSNYTLRLQSCGGTVLSDAIMGVKYIFTKDILNEEIYDFISETENNIKLYEYKNVLPIGLIYDTSLNEINKYDKTKKFEYQNYLYQKLFNRNEKLIDIVENTPIKIKEYDTFKNVEYDINIKNKSILYCYYDNDEYNKFIIEVNNQDILVPSKISIDNKYYPDIYNNGILDLGMFNKNEKVNINIDMEKSTDISSIHFGLLDYDKYLGIFEDNIVTNYKVNGNKLYFNVTVAGNNKKILLPFTYENEIIAKVNGKEEPINKELMGMISITLYDGENEIEIIYDQSKLLKIGALVSIFSICILILFFVFKKSILKCNILLNVSYSLYLVISGGLVIYIYLYGIISTFI